MSERTTSQTQRHAAPALTPAQGAMLQRACACGQHTIGGGECEECRKKRTTPVQRAPLGADPTGGASNGTPPSSTRAGLGHDFSRVRVQTHEASPPGLAISRPGDRHEQEAERAAARVMDMLGAQPPPDASDPVRLSDAAPSIQRAVDEAADTSATEAAIAPAEATATETAAPETTPSGLLVEDDAADAGPGQLRKSEFLAQLRAEICAATESILAAVGRTSDGCPYLDRWFGYYGARSAQHLERAIRRYAPETAGASAGRDYIAPIVGRIRQAVAVWAATGEITGVPEGFSPAMAAEAGAESEGGSAAGGGVALKAREGGRGGSMDAGAIRAQLGAGRALDTGVRAQMEAAFGQDFSAVRVHKGNKAAELAAGLNARAFTLGRDVAFGAGEYQPGTPIGDALIAHELAHVVQQGGANKAVAPLRADNNGSNALEEDADLSAIGAVGALWGGAKGTLKEIARNAKPRLRSGLRLGRCSVQTGGGISPSAFQFEQVTGGGDPNDRSLPWWAACVNITISHLGPAGRFQICQFEVGFPGIHRLGRTSTGTAQSVAAEAFNECVPALLRSRSVSCSAIASCVERRMRAQIPGAKVNFPCVTKSLTPTDWPTRH